MRALGVHNLCTGIATSTRTTLAADLLNGPRQGGLLRRDSFVNVVAIKAKTAFETQAVADTT